MPNIAFTVIENIAVLFVQREDSKVEMDMFDYGCEIELEVTGFDEHFIFANDDYGFYSIPKVMFLGSITKESREHIEELFKEVM